MGIEIVAAGDRYRAAVAPRHGPGHRAIGPLTSYESVQALLALGCRSMDVWDAFGGVDALWKARHDAELGVRRRQAGLDG